MGPREPIGRDSMGGACSSLFLGKSPRRRRPPIHDGPLRRDSRGCCGTDSRPFRRLRSSEGV